MEEEDHHSLMFREALNPESIQKGLTTRFVGRNVAYYDSIESTNIEAKALARSGAPAGTLVIADRQTGGRGRLNRQWLAPPGSSLLMSLIFRPELTPTQAARVPMICSLAVIDAIESLTPLSVGLKWPNDILIRGRKAGGILTELGLSGSRLDFAVVGIGLNVNLSFQDSWPEYEADAAPDTSRASVVSLVDRSTSLSRELGHEVSRLELLRRLLVNVETRYEALRRGQQPQLEWSRRLETLNRQVTAGNESEIITGWAEAVDEDGALLLRLTDGSLRRILVGDVTLRSVPEI
jgi:BirA family biotin operon repressor/biotin-[acetyl-CoA-carboxylase] ligase